MTELSFKLPGNYIHNLNEQPELMIFIIAFGVPLFMFVFAMTFSRLYKNTSIATPLNTIIFSTLTITWLAGSIISLVLFFMGVSGVKLLLIGLSLLSLSFVFTVINVQAIAKYSNDLVEHQKEKTEEDSVN